MRAAPKIFLLTIIILILFSVSSVSAQGTVRTNIENVDNRQFPLLEIYLSVIDVQGFPLKNLNNSNFSIAEDGQPVTAFEVTPIQNIQQPLAIALVIDTSGSMGTQPSPTPLQNAVQAARAFIDSLSQQDQVAIVGFANSPYVVQDFTIDRSLINTKLDSLTPGGNTTMYDGIVQAVNLLKNRSERRILVLITDGKDTGNGQFNFGDAVDEVSRWGIPIYTIGFGNVDRSELEKMGILTGGTAQIQPDSSDLQAAFSVILQVLRQQYLIRYTSALPADAAEHDLHITVDNQELTSSASRSFIAIPGKITITLPFKDGDTLGGNLLLKPDVIAPASLAQMDIQLDDGLLKSILSEPFEYAWDSTTIKPGLHKFTFIIKDKAGNTAQTSVNVNIRPPIKVNIVAPTVQQVLGGSTKVTADISSLSGIAKVDFTVDGKVLQTLTAKPYEANINWDNFSKGPHMLQVKATDVNGFSDTHEIVVQVKGKWDIWILILILGVGLAALSIPIGIHRRQKSAGVKTVQAEQAVLRELEGLNPGKVWPLGESDTRLGRRRENDIQLKSPKASREHAIIRYENGNYVLYISHKDNPAVVNNVVVRQKCILKPGDLIQLGDDVIRYERQ